MKKSLLGTAAIAAILICAGQAAHATPYAFASTTYNDFLITLGGSASADGGNVSTYTNQDYPGSVNVGTSVSHNFTTNDSPGTGATSANAFGGPGATYTLASPAPVGASSTPSPIPESSLKGGYGAQSSSSVGTSSVFSGPGDGARGAVENGGLVGGGALTATSSQTESVYTITTGGSVGTVTFSAETQVFVEALITATGEVASAGTTNTITEYCSAANGLGACNTAAAAVVDAIAGLQLAVKVGPMVVNDKALGSQTAFIPYTAPFTLDPNSTYTFELASVLTESTSTPAPAPEPASLAVLGTALLGLGGVVRRRRKG